MLAIYKKELKSYFNTALGFAYVAVNTMLIAIYFLIDNINYGYPYFSYALYSCATIMLFLVPIITMKCFSEENRNRTDQMLLTAPVNLWQVVLGKFLAVLTVYAIPLVISCIYPLVITILGDNSYLPVDYLTILMMFFFGMVFVAMGVFISSLTDNMVISGLVSFAAVFVLALWNSLTGFIPSTDLAVMIGSFVVVIAVAGILYGVTKSSMVSIIVGLVGIVAVIVTKAISSSALSTAFNGVIDAIDMSTPFQNLVKSSLFSFSGILKYLSATFIFILLTVQILHRRRWN